MLKNSKCFWLLGLGAIALIFIFALGLIIVQAETGGTTKNYTFYAGPEESDYHYLPENLPDEGQDEVVGDLSWVKNPPGLEDALIKASPGAGLSKAASLGDVAILSMTVTRPSTLNEGDRITVQFYCASDFGSYPDEIFVYVSKDGDFDLSDDYYVGKAYIDALPPGGAAYSTKLSFEMPNLSGCDYSIRITAALAGIAYRSESDIYVDCRSPISSIIGGSGGGGCFISAAQ